ncbi:MAG: tetratricopeptide repeat protein [Aphanocapsa sp. GSE-SYN-MK-11-07L]|jgi:hypothetical protein|nr:tetratricopeptide repeat protein [Aphanocapsa sp. GSE-SYN-MK-11-07L]
MTINRNLLPSSLLALILLGDIALASVVFASTPPQKRQTLKPCTPIARKLQTDGTAPQSLCAEDMVVVGKGQQITLLCTQRFTMVEVGQSGRVEELCGDENVIPSHRSSEGVNSFRARGNLTPLAIAPYGQVHLQERPTIRWQRIQGATTYQVRVTGGHNWSVTTDQLTLPYPKDQPSLRFGETYRITVTALRGNSPVMAIAVPYNLLTQAEAKQISGWVNQLEQVTPSKDDLAISELQSLYLAYGLWDEAIRVLQTRIAQRTTNPAVYRALGDRFLELGLASEAKTAYSQALKLSTAVNNRQEEVLAQQGLTQVKQLQSQLPSSTQGAQ